MIRITHPLWNENKRTDGRTDGCSAPGGASPATVPGWESIFGPFQPEITPFYFLSKQNVILPWLPLDLSVAVFNPVSGIVPTIYPCFPACVHPVFGYLCAWPLSDGRPSGLPSELLIGRCKSLSPSRDRANDHALCCLFSLWDTFRCPFRWPVLTMFNKTVKNVSVQPLFREQLPNLSVRSVPIRCSTGSIPMRFLRKNCGEIHHF